MSPPSSDFEAGDFGDPDFAAVAGEQTAVSEQPAVSAAPRYRKMGFNIYSVMLICSFVFMLVAMILFFIEAGSPDYK